MLSEWSSVNTEMIKAESQKMLEGLEAYKMITLDLFGKEIHKMMKLVRLNEEEPRVLIKNSLNELNNKMEKWMEKNSENDRMMESLKSMKEEILQEFKVRYESEDRAIIKALDHNQLLEQTLIKLINQGNQNLINWFKSREEKKVTESSNISLNVREKLIKSMDQIAETSSKSLQLITHSSSRIDDIVQRTGLIREDNQSILQAISKGVNPSIQNLSTQIQKMNQVLQDSETFVKDDNRNMVQIISQKIDQNVNLSTQNLSYQIQNVSHLAENNQKILQKLNEVVENTMLGVNDHTDQALRERFDEFKNEMSSGDERRLALFRVSTSSSETNILEAMESNKLNTIKSFNHSMENLTSKINSNNQTLIEISKRSDEIMEAAKYTGTNVFNMNKKMEGIVLRTKNWLVN
jgi:hypothetical protein